MMNHLKKQTWAVATMAALGVTAARGESWLTQTITPVTNPIFFEAPQIQTEIRPIFAWHRVDSGFVTGPADVRVYAVQLRYALTDRLALIATKDGYIEIEPKGKPTSSGWADLAAGLKYALFKSEDNQFIVTPGVTFNLPTGSRKVFQGDGDGELNLFVSAMKGWDKLHATVNIGSRIPFNFDRQTANIHYSGQLDYWLCRWFIPFVSANAFTTITDGNRKGLSNEGFDLINFGSANASGETQAAIGGGFRSRLLDNLDLGFAYESGVVGRNDIFKDRFTVDLSWRF